MTAEKLARLAMVKSRNGEGGQQPVRPLSKGLTGSLEREHHRGPHCELRENTAHPDCSYASRPGLHQKSKETT